MRTACWLTFAVISAYCLLSFCAAPNLVLPWREHRVVVDDAVWHYGRFPNFYSPAQGKHYTGVRCHVFRDDKGGELCRPYRRIKRVEGIWLSHDWLLRGKYRSGLIITRLTWQRSDGTKVVLEKTAQQIAKEKQQQHQGRYEFFVAIGIMYAVWAAYFVLFLRKEKKQGRLPEKQYGHD